MRLTEAGFQHFSKTFLCDACESFKKGLSSTDPIAEASKDSFAAAQPSILELRERAKAAVCVNEQVRGSLREKARDSVAACAADVIMINDDSEIVEVHEAIHTSNVHNIVEEQREKGKQRAMPPPAVRFTRPSHLAVDEWGAGTSSAAVAAAHVLAARGRMLELEDDIVEAIAVGSPKRRRVVLSDSDDAE